MLKAGTLTAVLLLAASAGAYVAPGPAEVFHWVAYPEAGNPETVNPAGLSFVRSLRLRFGFAMSDTTFEGFDRVSISLPGAGLSGWWDDDLAMRRFTLSSAVPLFENTASIGAGYTWFRPTVSSSPLSGVSLFTLGMTVRPLEWLSIGMVRYDGSDLPGDDDIEAYYRAGVGLRPLGPDLTLTADLETERGLDGTRLSAGLEVRPLEGLAIRANVERDRVALGMEAGLGRASLSAAAVTNDDYDYAFSRGDITFSPAPGADLLKPRGVFVRFETGKFDEMRTRPFLGSVRPCFTETALLLYGIGRDRSVAGVIVDIRGSAGSAAAAEELRGILRSMQSAGKEVYFYIEGGGSGEYYLASCGDAIWMHPNGYVSFPGLSSTSFFLRDLLDRMGVYPDLQHIGEYKSAAEMLIRSDMSEPHRTAVTALLESMQEELAAGVAEGRGFDEEELNAVMETGPYTALRAEEAGLVDGLCYHDRVKDMIEERLGRGIRILSLDDYASALPLEDEWGPAGHIAVVTASGSIMRGESGDSFIGRVMGSATISAAIREAASAPGVRALVLRIDSGGGDALASADMHHAVERAREDIPVIVSMGSVAASGGYYMACGADRIFADRMTVTGSIGIISGKLSFGEMLDSLGVGIEEVSTGPMASMYSAFRPFTGSERERAFELLRDGYDLFIGTVAEGREMTTEEVDAVGRGRVWSGADAMERGLVDECGGIVDAVMYAASITGMDTRRTPEVRVYPTPAFPGSMEMPGFGVSAGLLELLGSDAVLYLMQPLLIE